MTPQIITALGMQVAINAALTAIGRPGVDYKLIDIPTDESNPAFTDKNKRTVGILLDTIENLGRGDVALGARLGAGGFTNQIDNPLITSTLFLMVKNLAAGLPPAESYTQVGAVIFVVDRGGDSASACLVYLYDTYGSDTNNNPFTANAEFNT